MSIIAEFREFFLRNTVVPDGATPDQEVGYPTTYSPTINGVLQTVYNRFLKGNYPSGDVFSKFFNSILFKLNAGDSATSSSAGHVKTTNTTILGSYADQALIDGGSPDNNGFTRALTVNDAYILAPVGTIVMWGGSGGAIPKGWLACDGTVISATNFPALVGVLTAGPTATLPNIGSYGDPPLSWIIKV